MLNDAGPARLIPRDKAKLACELLIEVNRRRFPFRDIVIEISTDPQGQSQQGTLSIALLEHGEIDVDIHLLSGLDAGTCLKRDHNLIKSTVESGSLYLVVDTFTDQAGLSKPGPFLLTTIFTPNQ